MKLLFISDLWLDFPGGAERYIANVADAMAARGHEIHVFTSYEKAKSHHPLAIVDMGPGYDRGPGQIKLMIQEFRPDVLFTHHFFAGRFPEIWEQGLPVVEIVHNRQRNPRDLFALFNSEFTARKTGFQQGDFVMLPPVSDKALVEERGDYIGHIKPLGGKGIDFTYGLAARLPDKKFLVLRGEWQDGEDIRHLPNVTFMEPVADIREFYRQCRIVLMPSKSEDAGTVCQEAGANGIVAISSDVGGLPETNGGIVLPLDPELWETEIRSLDSPAYYKHIVDQQYLRLSFMAAEWGMQFDAIDRRLQECRTNAL